MILNVRNIDGKSFQINVEPSYTIENVKAKIRDREGIPPDQQRLLYGDRPLEDGRTLSECGVCENCFLHLVVRLRAGGCLKEDDPQKGAERRNSMEIPAIQMDKDESDHSNDEETKCVIL